MRLAGRIADWNDDKGFGFATPSGGGTRAFVHIHAFQRGSRRPVEGDLVSWLPVVDARGRTNATQVRHAGQKVAAPRQPSDVPRAALGTLALLLVAVAGILGWLPLVLVGAYAAASLLAFLMYRSDKVAAQRERQRTPEANLHLVGLLCGWPGALIAQQLFRHKTVKQPFQLVFLATVALNVAAVAWMLRSGFAQDLLAAFAH
ncbi:cold shock and DUF1294 domain-containing protein [Luteimonas sp. MJ246]|uniref:cold shock and DUF1294 domain-containing protein n=1 Tax=Luteimonas sp. MJ174 TaxID=3129237 RepID=UPI0031BB2295